MYFIDYDRQSLMHYGVKGMKWGVRNDDRRNDKVYKLTDKLVRNQEKADKYRYKADTKRAKYTNSIFAARRQARADKLSRKADKLEARSARHMTSHHISRNKRAEKYGRGIREQNLSRRAAQKARLNSDLATGNVDKVVKLENKAFKYEHKNRRLAIKMNKKYSNMSYTNIPQDIKDLGEMYGIKVLGAK